MTNVTSIQPTMIYKNMDEDDRAALKEIRKGMATKLKIDEASITIGDMIKATTPGLETPEHLKGC